MVAPVQPGLDIDLGSSLYLSVREYVEDFPSGLRLLRGYAEVIRCCLPHRYLIGAEMSRTMLLDFDRECCRGGGVNGDYVAGAGHGSDYSPSYINSSTVIGETSDCQGFVLSCLVDSCCGLWKRLLDRRLQIAV